MTTFFFPAKTLHLIHFNINLDRLKSQSSQTLKVLFGYNKDIGNIRIILLTQFVNTQAFITLQTSAS